MPAAIDFAVLLLTRGGLLPPREDAYNGSTGFRYKRTRQANGIARMWRANAIRRAGKPSHHYPLPRGTRRVIRRCTVPNAEKK